MNDLIKKTLEKIQQEHIVPESKWKFLLHKAWVWSLVFFFIILGAVAMAAAYSLLVQLDWDLYRTMHSNMMSYSFSLLPYPWLILLVIFLAVAFWGMRKTENGYRFSWSKIGLIVFSSLLFLGFLFSFFNFGSPVNHMMSGQIPYFMRHMTTKETQWMQPEKGLLAGTILVIEKNQFQLQDLDGKKWMIGISGKTSIRPSVDFSVGQMVKIIGDKKEQGYFEATEIRPWVGKGMMRSGGMGNGMMREN